MKSRRLLTLLLLCVLLAAAGCGGGGDDNGGGDSGDKSITFWTAEDTADRVAATQKIATAFEQKTGIKVKVVAIAEDQLATQVQSASAVAPSPT